MACFFGGLFFCHMGQTRDEKTVCFVIAVIALTVGSSLTSFAYEKWEQLYGKTPIEHRQ
jgi:hypothetical protein